MIRASITPGMARTRSSRSSRSMVAPTILCRWSECRGAPVRAGLREPHFPGRPPGTTGSGQDQDVIVVRLYAEHLMTSGDGLTRREPELLAGGSPDVDLLSVLVPESRHYSLHRDYLRVPGSNPSVSLRFRDLYGPVIALPCGQGVAQQFLNFLPLPQGQ